MVFTKLQYIIMHYNSTQTNVNVKIRNKNYRMKYFKGPVQNILTFFFF
jgi:hypothetical protein